VRGDDVGKTSRLHSTICHPWFPDSPASVAATTGVWEDARHAYVHETLVRRTGIAAALGVLYVALVQSLLQNGKIDFAVRVDCAVPGRLPRAEVSFASPCGSHNDVFAVLRACCIDWAGCGCLHSGMSVSLSVFPALQSPSYAACA